MDNIVIRPMTKEDVRECLDIKYEFFKEFYPNKNDHDQYILKGLDFTVSLVATVDEEIVGGYFIKRSHVPSMCTFFEMPTAVGLEGVSLFVKKEFHGRGIGNMLKQYWKGEGSYPYMWGQAFSGLGNLDDWLKRRVLFEDRMGVYYTIEIYNDFKLVPNGFKKFYDTNEVSLFNLVISNLKDTPENEVYEMLKNHASKEIIEESLDLLKLYKK
jgi:hypothetical protein